MYFSKDGLNLNREVNLTIDPSSGSISNCIPALVEYVHEIAALYPPPYNLFVSGGIDSQAMLYAWKLSGVSFNAIHVNYCGFNDHDFDECKAFCAIQDITVTIIRFNLLHFLEVDLDYYATTYRCASPQICTHMAFSELVDGTKVFSGNLPFEYGLPIDNTIFGLQRYTTIKNNNLIPFFLMQSEQVIKSSYQLFKKSLPYAMTSYEAKCFRYREAGFPIIPQVGKLTGFEKVKEYYDQYSDRVTNHMKLRFSKFPSKRVFDQLFRNKYLELFDNHYSATFNMKER